MFHLFSEAWLTHLAVGYGAAAVFVCVALESTGLPIPSESLLIAVAIVSASSDPSGSNIVTVILAAAAGGVIGDNAGYAIGRTAGRRILDRFGPRIGLGPPRQRLARYLFQRFGGRVVVAARFVSVLRTAVSLLAGTMRMPWGTFLLCNAVGACVWASIIGGGAYVLGDRLRAWSWPASMVLLAVVVLLLVGGAVLLRRKETDLQREADEAIGSTSEARA